MTNHKTEGREQADKEKQSMPSEFCPDSPCNTIYKLPENYYMYVRSVSNVSNTYSFKGGSTESLSKIRIIPNELVSQSDIWKLIETPYDSLRILRYPAAAITPKQKGFKKEEVVEETTIYVDDDKEYPTLTVLYDQYTTPKGIKITYYKQPAKFSLMTSTACELPVDAFEELVSGAVDLYVQYVAGAEANRRRQQEAVRQQQEKNNRQKNNE